MATKLDKDITRESTIQVDGNEIIVTLTARQKISMKLKGKRIGGVEISIEELYGQLTGKPTTSDEPTEKKAVSVIRGDGKPTKKNPMILLSDLRSQSAISGLDYETLSKFDGIIKNLIDKI